MIFSRPCTAQVPGNLVFSARSGAHSFDASQMNISHVISHLSFGKKLSPWLISDIQKVQRYIGESNDKLNGQTYINRWDENVTVSFTFSFFSLKPLAICFISF